jgi:hypothetical protein
MPARKSARSPVRRKTTAPAAAPAPAAPAPEAAAPEKGGSPDARRARGEPPAAPGAVYDPKTGRLEKPAPGTFNPDRRRPQTA